MAHSRHGGSALPAGLVIVALAGCGGPLKSDELRRGIESLENTAATGVLVSRGVVDRGTKTTFVRVEARDLADDADHEAEKLGDSIGQDRARVQAIALAQELAGTLRRLQVRADDPRVAQDVMADLGELEDRAKRLAETP